MKFEHKLGIIVASIAAPGFAQALSGRWRAALVWMALELVPSVLGTMWFWLPMVAMVLRVAAGVAAFLELKRFESTFSWWTRLSVIVLVVGLGCFAFLRATVEGFKIPSSSMYPTLVIGDHIYVDKLSLEWRPPERGEVIVFEYPCDQDRDYIKRVIAIGGDTVEVRCNVIYVNGEPVKTELVEEAGTYKDYDEGWFARPMSRYRETHGGHRYEVFHDPDRPARDRSRDTLTSGDTRDFPHRDRMFAPSCHQPDYYQPKPGIVPQLAGRLVITKQDAKACEPQAHLVVPQGGLFVMGDNRNNANDSRVWGVVSIDAVIGRAMGIWMTKAPGGDGTWSRVGAVE